jgi:hypothetical protein
MSNIFRGSVLYRLANVSEERTASIVSAEEHAKQAPYDITSPLSSTPERSVLSENMPGVTPVQPELISGIPPK